MDGQEGNSQGFEGVGIAKLEFEHDDCDMYHVKIFPKTRVSAPFDQEQYQHIQAPCITPHIFMHCFLMNLFHATISEFIREKKLIKCGGRSEVKNGEMEEFVRWRRLLSNKSARFV